MRKKSFGLNIERLEMLFTIKSDQKTPHHLIVKFLLAIKATFIMDKLKGQLFENECLSLEFRKWYILFKSQYPNKMTLFNHLHATTGAEDQRQELTTFCSKILTEHLEKHLLLHLVSCRPESMLVFHHETPQKRH